MSVFPAAAIDSVMLLTLYFQFYLKREWANYSLRAKCGLFGFLLAQIIAKTWTWYTHTALHVIHLSPKVCPPHAMLSGSLSSSVPQPRRSRELVLRRPAGRHHPHGHRRTLRQHARLHDPAGAEEAQGESRLDWFVKRCVRNTRLTPCFGFFLPLRTQTMRASSRRPAASRSRPTSWPTTPTTCRLSHSLPVTMV